MKTYLRLPQAADLAPFLAAENARPFTYADVEKSREPDFRAGDGFDHDRQRLAVGAGVEDFERAKNALRAWAHFPQAWTRILPENAPLLPGQTIAMFFRLFGLWWRNSCRIVYVIDEPARFGFAYGTLPAHLERGEELFLVELDAEDRVWYELRAFSRPRHLLARLGYPFVRSLQEKFRQDSALAVRRFVRDEGPANEPVLSPDGWFLRIFLFLLAAAGLWPGSLWAHDYGKLPLALAFLLIVPAGLLLSARHLPALRPSLARIRPLLLPAGMAATLALALPAGLIAALLMLPWAILCGLVAATGLFILLKTGPQQVYRVALAAGSLLLIVGGGAALSDRAGWRPLGFGDDIVRLTALHFHYAGFALPVLAGVVARLSGSFWAKTAAGCVIAGIPLTAAGITATQLHAGPWLETFAAVFMAVAGLSSGLVWLALGLRRRQGLLATAGVVLLASMSLALGYALRVVAPELALSLDWMRALHGSLNGLVAIPLGLLGAWWLGER